MRRRTGIISSFSSPTSGSYPIYPNNPYQAMKLIAGSDQEAARVIGISRSTARKLDKSYTPNKSTHYKTLAAFKEHFLDQAPQDIVHIEMQKLWTSLYKRWKERIE